MVSSKPVFQVSVRELVEFSLRAGDLGGSGEFVGPGRALAGIRGHQKVQRSRPPEYRKEVGLSHDLEQDEFVLRIQGRIDGLLESGPEVLLEEIKTVGASWDGQADPLHWAQAKIYGHIFCSHSGPEKILLGLTYLNLETGSITELRAPATAAELAGFFEQTTAVYLGWLTERYHWCHDRNASIEHLQFPFPHYRPGQRQLAVSVYRVLRAGGRLFLEAPTGIGKTISVLFPAVKAMAEGKLDRLFYLTARTVGRSVAEKAFNDLRQGGARFRTLTLTAKGKICPQPGTACDPGNCPFARGYYDRVKPAMRAALEHDAIDRSLLERLSREHQVCPFELSLDLSSWVDGVICDYNYVFDPKVYLRRHFAEEGGDYAFLVDEAHNLVDRAREMFSAELDTRQLQETRRAIRGRLSGCYRVLGKLNTALKQLAGSAPEQPDTKVEETEPGLFISATDAANGSAKSTSAALNDSGDGVLALKQLPESLLPALDRCLKEAEAWLARNEPAEFRDALLDCYFSLFSFARTAELYDERYRTLVQTDAAIRVRLFCLDPSFLLAKALARGKAAVFFSATLSPADYYRTLLGGEVNDPVLQLASPFPPGNLAVLVQGGIRTDYKSRASTLPHVAQALAAAVRGRPGNYLVYLPSYQYLRSLLEQFQLLEPSARVLAQTPGMSEEEREEFLAAFSADNRELLVGFAVLGGIFGEGIDLVGDRLLGAVVVGVGLPQLCIERDLIRDHFQEVNGAGFDYAYTFPGMNRVLQAIGRVIRSERDRGLVLLIDARFCQWRYRALFPSWWHPVQVRSISQISHGVEQFWEAAAATSRT